MLGDIGREARLPRLSFNFHPVSVDPPNTAAAFLHHHGIPRSYEVAKSNDAPPNIPSSSVTRRKSAQELPLPLHEAHKRVGARLSSDPESLAAVAISSQSALTSFAAGLFGSVSSTLCPSAVARANANR
jgi:hypothetical protein